MAVLLVFACWPRIESSSASLKAAVQEPVFVAQTVVAPQPEQTVAAPQPKQAAAPALDKAREIARDAVGKLASALRGASVDQTPIASLDIPIDDARRLCAEGLIAFARGDIAGARAFLKRASENGDPRALMALGDTYDPTTLSRLGAQGLKGDEAVARSYYSRALAAGVGGARERIAALAAK